LYNHKFPQGIWQATSKSTLLTFSSQLRRHLMRFFLAFDLAANKRKQKTRDCTIKVTICQFRRIKIKLDSEA